MTAKPIYLFDTLHKEKRVFTPIKENEVTMYHCGPTVYDYLQIGNLRSFMLGDLLRRVFQFNGYKVKQVMNVTDIGHLISDADSGDDKMTKALRREGKELNLKNMKDIALFYTEAFKNDLVGLNIMTPHVLPMASDHIQEDMDLIATLSQKGLTYATSDGLYFDTIKYPEYGKLGGVAIIDEKELQSRLATNPEKKDPRDFALWKFNPELGYEAPWGKGFPGWHIECSAMSMKYLGETFDIHTGGIDLISTHHNNEIAQSENATGKAFAHYWLHGAFLNLKDAKMAKSTGGISLKDLIEKGYSPLDYRYLLLTAHWSTSLNFSYESLDAAKQARQRLVQQGVLMKANSNAAEIIDQSQLAEFTDIVNDNLNMPGAVSYVWGLIKSNSINISTLLKFDEVLGLNLNIEIENNIKSEDDFQNTISDDIKKIIEQRDLARQNKEWKKSDELRDFLTNKGYEVFDTPEGTRIKKLEV
ncbi:MAG: cysteine--tRNA ligase [bacterium]